MYGKFIMLIVVIMDVWVRSVKNFDSRTSKNPSLTEMKHPLHIKKYIIF